MKLENVLRRGEKKSFVLKNNLCLKKYLKASYFRSFPPYLFEINGGSTVAAFS